MIMPIIAPSILSADIGRLDQEIESIVAAGASFIHIDVMDGVFVPPITFGDNVVKAIKKSFPKLFLDVHLMVINPESKLESFAKAGANQITIHIEACQDPVQASAQIKGLGCKAGLTLNPATPIERVTPYLANFDQILVMSVNPGWGGQKFIDSSIDRIRSLRDAISKEKLKTAIEVDGGVGITNAASLITAGANILVAGSAIFSNKDRTSAFCELQKVTNEAYNNR